MEAAGGGGGGGKIGVRETDRCSLGGEESDGGRGSPSPCESILD